MIAKLEQGLDTAARAARTAARSATSARPDGRPDLAALQGSRAADPGDCVRFRQGNAAVAGQRGENPGIRRRRTAVGGTEKGLSIAARPGGQVTAPCDGWVVYAGTFRNYGQLLILNAGGGYHVLLAGMERISVDWGSSW